MTGLLDADGAPWDYQAAGAMELLREERHDACEDEEGRASNGEADEG